MDSYDKQILIEIKELLKLALEEEKLEYVSDAMDLLENPTADLFDDFVDGRVVIFSAIDNLVKGAAGQAIQNMNLVFQLSEIEGLSSLPLFP